MFRVRLARKGPLSFLGGLLRINRRRNYHPSSVTVGNRWLNWNSRRGTFRSRLLGLELETRRPDERGRR